MQFPEERFKFAALILDALTTSVKRRIFLGVFIFYAFTAASRAVPERLIIALDGVSYRDVRALQEGITETNFWGGVAHRRAFTAEEGYYPVSRMVSTFPSTSDVAWTDIFGNRPLPGYQRTYFSVAANSQVALNGLTTTVEHERQMNYETDNNFVRSMGYIYSVHVFEYEVRKLSVDFWNSDDTNANYYVYIRSSDDAQHMDRNVFSLLCILDKRLQELRARYEKEEGHDLPILILSDHGHNHAGRGERVQVRPYLEKRGYHISESIQSPKDVVLPTSGIEDWVEIHNAPSETERLAELLTHLQGADVIAARLATNSFLVLNSKGERATIRWNRANNTFRYTAEKGDPLNYLPVMDALRREKRLDANGFATADDLMNETMTNHYPLALQRIVRGLTCVTLNPATILISLDNHYVHAGWLVNEGSMLETCGSTHGALDDINSLGIVLSNFTPTHDTSSDRVSEYFDNFPAVRNYRAEENGAEWVSRKEQSRVRIRRDPFDWNYRELPGNDVFLRVWSPALANPASDVSIETDIEKLSALDDRQIAGTFHPRISHEDPVIFTDPVSLSHLPAYERIYRCPAGLALKPYSEYRMAGAVHSNGQAIRLFDFIFRTDGEGKPVAF